MSWLLLMVVEAQCAPVLTAPGSAIEIRGDPDPLAALLGKKLPAELYKQSGIDVGNGTTLQVIVTRRGPPTVTAPLKVALPLHVDLRVDWRTEGPFGITIKHHEDLPVDLTLFADVSLRVQRDGTVVADTEPTVRFDGPVELALGPATISLRSELGGRLAPQLGLVAMEVDSWIEETLSLDSLLVAAANGAE